MTTTEMTTADVTDLALDVVRGLLRGDELESFEVGPNPPPNYKFPNDSDRWLHVRARGEWFYLPLTGDPSTDHLVARLESNLQDWIAESHFGWGELRFRSVDTPV